jgi:FkbM family methyltransferase
MFRKIYNYYSNVILKGNVLPFYYRFLRSTFKLFGIFAKATLSQSAEDIIIEKILKDAKKNKGIFVDVGCNHPIEYNNTYLLYLRGKRGINIDGNADLIKLYSKYRNNDTNLNYLISDKEEEVVFNLSHKDKISTIHFDEIEEGNEKQFPTHLRTKMTTKTLNTVLIENNIVGAGEIDLLCIDVENHDFEVISSIDLNKYQPYLVVIEILNLDINNPTANKTYNLLYQNGYKLKHFVFSNGFFIREQA